MACANICSHDSIEVFESELGFKYPRIIVERCVDCGLCKRVCPANNARELVFPGKCYAARLNDSYLLNESASGGAATAFALAVIQSGGVVIGCSGENMMDVKHIVIESEKDIHKLQGSKYVQSSIADDLYQRIKKFLSTGRMVLFIGTACQTAGLQNFLLKPYENLFTVDLICHGVPSQKMLNDCICSYTGMDPDTLKFRQKISNANSKTIRYGWFYTIHSGENARQNFVPAHKNPYMAAFLDLLTFRECCYRCKYAYSARQSDITIGDFWGLGANGSSKINPREGASVILIVTNKGHRLLDLAKTLLYIEEREIQEAIMGNRQLQLPSKENPLRRRFEALYKTKGFVNAIRSTTIRNNRLKRVFLIPGKIIKIVASYFHIKL